MLRSCLKSDSHRIVESAILLGDVRWITSDRHLVAPAGREVILFIGSDDVIHNFNLKRLSLSVDCVPGRIAVAGVNSIFTGHAFGLCRELCGVGHSHIPCTAEFISLKDYCR